jgi:hypothetical protein
VTTSWIYEDCPSHRPWNLLLLTILALLFALELKRTQAETGAILSAYLTDELLRDYHNLDSGRGVQVILQREAQNLGSWRWRWTLLLDRRSLFRESSLTSRISFFLTNTFSTDVKTELHLSEGVQSVFLTRRELEQTGATSLQARFPNNLGYVAFSRVGLNLTKNEAILYIDHFCGLCGGGGYVLMRKIDGVWRVAAQHITWVS